jgi:hypothetical protein
MRKRSDSTNLLFALIVFFVINDVSDELLCIIFVLKEKTRGGASSRQ